MDINNTLLNGQIKEAIYMCHPEGVMIQLARPQHNCKLAKAIYGLKQTPRAWFHRLRGALLGLGISQHKNKEDITFLLIYICR